MTAMDIHQALQTAMARHRNGQLVEAEAIYRQILARQPNHPDALHLLGVIDLTHGRHEDALRHISQAMVVAPNQPVFHANLGETLRQLGRLDEAVACLQGSISLKPDFPEAWNTLGSALAQKGQWPDAIASFERAITLRPNFADCILNLGNAWVAQERFDDAVPWFRRLVALRPEDAGFHNRLGNALVRGGYWDEAIAACQRAIELSPDFMEAHGNIAVACLGQGEFEEAMIWGRKALALRPDSAEVLSNLTGVCLRTGENQAALEYCERALAAEPHFAPTHWNYSQILLLLGRYEEGWREYEWRWQSPPLSAHRRPFTAPPWDGSPVDGQTLLVYAEQGFGDAIQFLRYVPFVKQRTRAGRVIFECFAPLLRLFAEAGDLDAEVVSSGTLDGSNLPRFDRHVALHSLPFALGMPMPEAITPPYLRADPQLREVWRERLGPQTTPRVGLLWAGTSHPQWHRRRSLPAEQMLPLLRVPQVQFYSLQFEPRDGAPPFLRDAGLIDLTAHLGDFADTAAFMAELDLVITIDTAAAHLAGALGRPVWTLLPFASDWRWGLDPKRTPWYPAMRLFRQPVSGDWDSVIARVVEALRNARL